MFLKKVGRKPKRRKRVYKRAVCPFLGKEMLRNECAGDFSKKAAASYISLAAAWRRRRVLFLEFQTIWLRFVNIKNPHNKGVYRACAIIFAHIKKTIVCKKRVRNVYRSK